MLAYGVFADAIDEYCRLAESTSMLTMKRFCRAICAKFGPYHLRQPTRDDLEKQLTINAQRGWPGMFASIDCMHYEWKNCLVAWQGDYGNRDGYNSIILEAIADQSLHIWHTFFGLPGANNDLNVLDRSPLVQNMLTGEGNNMQFVVNGMQYNRYYLLADGIYLLWSCFVQTLHAPSDAKQAHFAKQQESARKDVEHCFGVLQACFTIIQKSCRQWTMECITDIMLACCILHNMIVEDEENEGLNLPDHTHQLLPMQRHFTYDQLVMDTFQIKNEDAYYSLRGDLIDHLWALKGANTDSQQYST